MYTGTLEQWLCVAFVVYHVNTRDWIFWKNKKKQKKNSLNGDIGFLQASEDSIICLR